MKKLFALLCLNVLALFVVAQEMVVYPTHWWTGMKHNPVHLLVRNPGISATQRIQIKPYPGVTVGKITRYENKEYLAFDLVISPQARPGVVELKFLSPAGEIGKLAYELKAKSKEDGKTRVKGVNSKDFTYLLMPDRFSNGDPSNDAYADMRDKEADRKNKFARHGGDIKGVQDKLDYFNDLGITTIWFTPVTENDMPREREGVWDMSGYHGYWFTDHYKVDKRYGGNEVYKNFIAEAHKKGLKIIQDAIYNHVGMEHWLNRNPPSPDWINRFPKFTGPNHRDEVLMDPYGSKYDKENQIKGWFTPHLPDLNLGNPELAIFLIQHGIWSVEEFGFDGFRIDTYKYCDERFLNKMNAALVREFPTLTTFVEAWANTVAGNAYYVQNNFNIPFKHNAQGAIDFPLCFAMHAGMNQPFGWNEGVNRLYSALSQDFVYKNPLDNCIFLDNHDLDRAFSVAKEDLGKFKWGLNWLLTMRGIPQIFYGTEILMKNFKNPTDAEVRFDFPGGWKEDAVNKFTREGRTAQENEAFDYIRTLAHFRKSSSALTTGKTMQYVVRDGCYIYFRYDDKQTIMVATNSGSKAYAPDWAIYAERVQGFTKARNVITGEVKDLKGLEIPAGAGWVMELVK